MRLAKAYLSGFGLGQLKAASVSNLKITEAASVQFRMVARAYDTGWTSILPKDVLQKRGGETGMLF